MAPGPSGARLITRRWQRGRRPLPSAHAARPARAWGRGPPPPWWLRAALPPMCSRAGRAPRGGGWGHAHLPRVGQPADAGAVHGGRARCAPGWAMEPAPRAVGGDCSRLGGARGCESSLHGVGRPQRRSHSPPRPPGWPGGGAMVRSPPWPRRAWPSTAGRDDASGSFLARRLTAGRPEKVGPAFPNPGGRHGRRGRGVQEEGKRSLPPGPQGSAGLQDEAGDRMAAVFRGGPCHGPVTSTASPYRSQMVLRGL